MKAAFLLAFLVAVLSSPELASAQYPEPVGSVIARTANSTVSAGGATVISCTLLDTGGDPVVGEDVVISITAQPGGASLAANQGTTDASGTASTVLQVGSTPGLVVVACISGELTSQVFVEVMGVTAAPPQAPLSAPSTGDGGLIPAPAGPMDEALATVLVIFALGLAWKRARSRF
jgi:hypothetical protein